MERYLLGCMFDYLVYSSVRVHVPHCIVLYCVACDQDCLAWSSPYVEIESRFQIGSWLVQKTCLATKMTGSVQRSSTFSIVFLSEWFLFYTHVFHSTPTGVSEVQEAKPASAPSHPAMPCPHAMQSLEFV
jgi:hypothetical protein